MNSASSLKILSSNVRGFNNVLKQKKMILHFEKYAPDIMCISDTRFDDLTEMQFKNKSEYNSYHSNYSSNARGTMILVSKKSPIIVESTDKDDNGNRITIKFKFDGKSFSLSSIYGPNSDCPEFFENVFEKTFESNSDYNIISGDFNTAPSHDLDYKNYAEPRHPRARTAINNLLNVYDCADAYRIINDNKCEYSWRAEGGRPQMSRLDLCIVGNNLTPFLSESSINTAFLSDHDFLINVIDFHKIRRGKGSWCLDNDLLKDKAYTTNIERTIKETLAKYAKVGTYDNFLQECSPNELAEFMNLSPFDLHELEYNLNPNLLMEMLIMDIRLESIGFAIAKKRKNNVRSRFLVAEIARLRSDKDSGTITDADSLTLQEYSDEYDSLIEDKALKIMQRDKILAKISGEKASRYFCNLEKDRACEKYIPKLTVKNNDGSTKMLVKQQEIEKEITNFYQNLYKNKDDMLPGGSIEEFLEIEPNVVYPKLTNYQAEGLNGDITLEEMKNILDKSKKGSAPGVTGLTFEFYCRFWDFLGHFLVNCANYSYSTGTLPSSLSQGLISLLPKGEKERDQLGNWRPLTLLSVEYKIISGCIAQRLSGVMDKIIGPDQNGYVKDRFIGESIRTVFDVMSHAKTKNTTGMLLLVDFKKAFDCLSHNFILKCLTFYGFGADFISWIKLLIENFKACTTHAGNISNPFLLGRGSKQGDPISSLLFILCIEILSIKISKRIVGFKVGGIHMKKTLYADDLSVFLEYSERDLRAVMTVLEDFYKLSGLEINRSKTQVVIFGKIPEGDYEICKDLKLSWKQSFKLLGIVFDTRLEKMFDNYTIAIEKIEKVISNWRFRFMTIYGRNVIAKTLLLSKLAHIHMVLPDLPSKTITELERIIYKFLWRGTDKVCRVDAKLAEEKGGLNFPDIKKSMDALKLSWFRRGYSNPSASWVSLLNETLV